MASQSAAPSRFGSNPSGGALKLAAVGIGRWIRLSAAAQKLSIVCMGVTDHWSSERLARANRIAIQALAPFRSGSNPSGGVTMFAATITGVSPAAMVGYIKATLEAIAQGHPNDRLDELLPWSFKTASS